MSKRASVASNNMQPVARRDKDKYYTPLSAVVPLVPHLPEYANFGEPCCGNGSLIRHIEALTEGAIACTWASDLEPDQTYLEIGKTRIETPVWDARFLSLKAVVSCDLIITNPPFKWDILQPMLDHLPKLKPTWLLLPFGYAANKRMAPYMKTCRKVQPIGRVKWIEDSAATSTDDYMWALFDSDFTGTTKLYPRT